MAFASLLALAGSITAAALYLTVYRLPDPGTASGDGLARWLVDRDLSREPESVRRTLVDRLVAELPRWSERMDGLAHLGDARHQRLEQNIAVLKQVWFASRVDEFCRLAPAERSAFLDTQLSVIGRWSDVAAAAGRPGQTPPTDAESGAGISLMHDIDRWIGEASGDEKDRMLRAVSAGLARWLMISDLAAEPFALRSELAERIAVAMDGGLQPAGILSGRPPHERSRLQANALLLMEAWYHRCAERYAALSDVDEKARYVDRQIERIESWSIEGLMLDENNPASDSAPGMVRLVELVNVWIGRAPARQRAELEDFFAALQQRYFLRLLQVG